MGKPIPTLGHPSRGVAVGALLAMGKSRPEIAALLNTNLKNVHSLEYNEANKHKRKPTREHRISIGRLAQQLRPFATRRGMETAEFVQFFLRAAVESGLIDHILDDRISTPSISSKHGNAEART